MVTLSGTGRRLKLGNVAKTCGSRPVRSCSAVTQGQSRSALLRRHAALSRRACWSVGLDCLSCLGCKDEGDADASVTCPRGEGRGVASPNTGAVASRPKGLKKLEGSKPVSTSETGTLSLSSIASMLG